MRSDIRARKVEVVTEAMQLTGQEAAAFWPIYREYELELSKIWDGRLALISTYAKRYETMTDAVAQELAERYFELETRTVRLHRDYFREIGDAVSPRTAFRFTQVENRLDLLISVQLASQLPLIVK